VKYIFEVYCPLTILVIFNEFKVKMKIFNLYPFNFIVVNIIITLDLDGSLYSHYILYLGKLTSCKGLLCHAHILFNLLMGFVLSVC
jgi:hypothetical protein